MSQINRLDGFVFYPRHYHVDNENPDNSFIDGVDCLNQPYRVFIAPNDKARQRARADSAATIPQVSKMASRSRKANNCCHARPDNNPDNPEGVMLIEQPQWRPDGSIQAGWVSVLRESSDMPLPTIGIGGLEFGFNPKPTQAVAGLLNKYRQIAMRTDVEGSLEKARLFNEILNERLSWFVAAIIKHNEIVNLGQPTKQTPGYIEEVLAAIVEQYTARGHYGGAWIRVRSDDRVSKLYSFQINRQYDYSRGVVQSVDDVIANFRAYKAARLAPIYKAKMPIDIDIIPVERINAGKGGNDKFKKDWMARPDGSVPKLQKLYLDKNYYHNPLINPVSSFAHLVSKIAVREAIIEEGATAGNLLLSNIHAFSKPMGHALQISSAGIAEYKIQEQNVQNKPEYRYAS